MIRTHDIPVKCRAPDPLLRKWSFGTKKWSFKKNFCIQQAERNYRRKIVHTGETDLWTICDTKLNGYQKPQTNKKNSEKNQNLVFGI